MATVVTRYYDENGMGYKKVGALLIQDRGRIATNTTINETGRTIGPKFYLSILAPQSIKESRNVTSTKIDLSTLKLGGKISEGQFNTSQAAVISNQTITLILEVAAPN